MVHNRVYVRFSHLVVWRAQATERCEWKGGAPSVCRTMSKLYVGNLPADANEAALRQLLQEHGVSVTSVLVKRGGYAFIDCAEQSAIDRAIEKLNGTLLLFCFPFSPLLPVP